MKPDGDRAFGSTEPINDVIGVAVGGAITYQGMSLRDWFAWQTLPQAIQHERDMRAGTIAPCDFRYDAIARAAYVMADAMLKERAK